jgi:hypothetical protein
MSAPTKDLCVIWLDESANISTVRARTLNAFREGIYCFKFVLKFYGRTFEDRVALPADSDEECALEMATYQFARFMNTVGQLAAKRL